MEDCSPAQTIRQETRFDATGRGALWISGQLGATDLTTSHRPNSPNRSGQLMCYLNRSIQFVIDRNPRRGRGKQLVEESGEVCPIPTALEERHESAYG